MSWLIDELNAENIELKKQLYRKDVKFNKLVSDFSEFITQLDELNKELDKKDGEIKDLKDKIEFYRVMVDELGLNLSALYPDFKSRLKFLFRGKI